MKVEESFYLGKYGYGTPRIEGALRAGTQIIVTIPCHNEPAIEDSLLSLSANDDPGCNVEIIVVINASANSDEAIHAQNKISAFACKEVMKDLPEWLTLHVIEENELPKKHAGVGLARKIAMDEASWRFESSDIQEGIISCYDADSLCAPNYLRELKNHFESHRKSPGCSIRYEHPLNGQKFPNSHYEGIGQYELHLRYYTMQQKWLNLPYAFQTVGSSMAVRWQAYQLEGGMNKRKAGEDFYFLHKIIARGNFTELVSTRVVPSPRSSDRVPFGTGKAVQDFLDRNGAELSTYNTRSFDDLDIFLNGVLLDRLDRIQLPQSIIAYLKTTNWEEAIEEIKSNSATKEAFVKRFYRWFNAFRLMKYLHFSRDNFHPNLPVVSAAKSALVSNNVVFDTNRSLEELVAAYRDLEYDESSGDIS